MDKVLSLSSCMRAGVSELCNLDHCFRDKPAASQKPATEIVWCTLRPEGQLWRYRPSGPGAAQPFLSEPAPG